MLNLFNILVWDLGGREHGGHPKREQRNARGSNQSRYPLAHLRAQPSSARRSSAQDVMRVPDRARWGRVDWGRSSALPEHLAAHAAKGRHLNANLRPHALRTRHHSCFETPVPPSLPLSTPQPEHSGSPSLGCSGQPRSGAPVASRVEEGDSRSEAVDWVERGGD